MRQLIFIILFINTNLALAQNDPQFETITLERPHSATLIADFHPAADSAPVILLLHMLNSNRSAYDPLVPDLRDAGYAILNIDLRGHGASGGSRDWDLAINDVALGWTGWLAENNHLSDSGLAIIGGSIGANVALDQLRPSGRLPRRHRPLARPRLSRRQTRIGPRRSLGRPRGAAGRITK